MQLTTFVVAASALLLPSVLANKAIVKNNCNYATYVQSVTNNGGGSGPVITLAASGGSYSETFQSAGAAIRLGIHAALSNPLTFEYTPSGNLVYYDLSNNAGSPWVNQYVDLFPSDTTCPKFDCGPQAQNCYSNGGNIQVKACESATDLVVTLCATS